MIYMLLIVALDCTRTPCCPDYWQSS